MMKSTRIAGLTALVLLASGLAAQAQVRMRATLDRNEYLLGEGINLTVVIENLSGNILDFGTAEKPQGSLYVEIFDSNGKMRSNYQRLNGKYVQANPMLGVRVSPGVRHVVDVPLDAFHDLNREGDFEIRAYVAHDRMKYDFESSLLRFKIRKGRLEWQQYLGMPAANPDAPIQMRQVKYLTLKTEEGVVAFYQVSDEDYIYSTTRMGRIVDGSPPQFEIDSRSQVHMLVATQPRVIGYYVYDLRGQLRDNRFFEVDNTVPRLQKDPDIGRVMVTGGKPIVRAEAFDASEIEVMDMH